MICDYDYNYNLISHLSHIKDLELHVLTLRNRNKQIKQGNLIIHMFMMKPFYFPFLDPRISNIKGKILEIDPDIIHLISTSYLYSPIATSLRNKYPIVLSIYGIASRERKYERTEYKKVSQFVADFISIINERYVLSRIRNIIVEAQSIKNLVNNWTKSKIYVVPVGIEYEKILETQKHNFIKNDVDIFTMCRLQKIKGVDILIKSIHIVKKSIPNIRVQIAGFGAREKELNSLVKKLHLEDNVKFLGFVPEEVKYKYYAGCKIVVVPSRWDCQPFTLFEAAASGKPVIASDMSNPGIVDDGKTGLIFKSENISDLADKISILLNNDTLREKIGTSSREKAKEYDWNKIAEKTVDIYKDVILNFPERKKSKIS